jgi:hypothetical protein
MTVSSEDANDKPFYWHYITKRKKKTKKKSRSSSDPKMGIQRLIHIEKDKEHREVKDIKIPSI